jgi:hypothetical protein
MQVVNASASWARVCRSSRPMRGGKASLLEIIRGAVNLEQADSLVIL